ncbi:cytochrome P450 [Parafrankia discariae]|uniref:cytochrome P450 n=1 Tax=Parafrankia discariae TaxID=365528 RepID=UPI000379F9FE|nr:cytochrome P450 [Parafrankia discariae]
MSTVQTPLAAPPLLAALTAARRIDPYPTYRAIRESDPLPALELAGRRITLVTRHADASAVFQNPAFGHGHRENISPFRPDGDTDDGLDSLLRADPPHHTRLRRLASRAVTPSALATLTADITAFVTTLLDAALAAGEVDAVTALAQPTPLRVICHLLGIPAADEPVFGAWAAALIRGIDPDFLLTPDDIAARRQAQREMDDYFRRLIARVRTSPGTDLLSQLVEIHLGDDTLSESEILALCAVMLVAGQETTANLIASGILALLRNPDQLAVLRADPDLVPTAVDEMLRHEAPVQFLPRTALRDTELGGRPFRRGEGALVLVGSAHRDPAAFADPDRFLVTRYAAAAGGSAAGAAPVARHFGFGLGIHYCLGAALARLETEITFRLLLERTSGLALIGGPPVYRDQSTIRGLRELPVRLTA